MRDFFLSSPWPGAIAWALIYISDYFSTITCARLYRRNLSDKIVFEGSLELNPIFQRDVDAMKWVSPKFLLLLVLSSALMVVYWVLCVPDYPAYYEFVLGGAICLELAVHVRHLGNLHLFGSRITAEQLRGRIEYDRQLILRMSSVGMLGVSILFAVVFAFTGSWFVCGGMATSFFSSAKHWYLSRRAAAKRREQVQQALARSTSA